MVKNIAPWLQTWSQLLVALATVVLVVVTYFYLRETKKQRSLMEKTVAVDTAPRVFIKDIISTPTPDPKRKEVRIGTTITLKNCGKTEAKKVKFHYKITIPQKTFEGEKGPFDYIFPGQESAYMTEFFGIPLDEEQWKRVETALESGKRLTISVSKGLPSPELSIDLLYEDIEQNKYRTEYALRYHWDNNKWSYTAMGIE